MSILNYFIKTSFSQMRADYKEWRSLCNQYSYWLKNCRELEYSLSNYISVDPCKSKQVFNPIPGVCISVFLSDGYERMIIDEKHYASMPKTYKFFCGNFSKNKKCDNAQCGRQLANHAYVYAYKKMTDVHNNLSHFWSNKFKQSQK